MNVPFLDLKRQYKSIKPEIDAAIAKVVESQYFVAGPETERFEKEFATYCSSKFGIGVNSGTSALHIALIALGVGKGDEVITCPNSFFATAEVITAVGATPVFADINQESFCMDAESLNGKITNRTKAIIPVHLYGQMADMGPIMEIAEGKNLAVIEDAAQAHGALYNGRKSGSFGVVGCFSFYPGKNLGAYGEGGMCVTSDAELDEKLKLLRAHGERPKHRHRIPGFNFRLEEIQAAVLNVKLKHLDSWNAKRSSNAKLYGKLLQNSSVKTPKEMPYGRHVYHIYCVRSQHRDKLAEFLKQKGISTAMHYPTPIHLQEAYTDLGYKEGSVPNCEKAAKEILSLPMFAELTEEEIAYVTDSVKEFKA
ncbi:DegT/DnrJ/EryC1/StrS family aminotransferase [Candidatus Woesearchaeota archaeon]|nr:DegT/DnrJ/EryC1/StrS family aminotransferase [Candidatus Woesearchaeota archaeon]